MKKVFLITGVSLLLFVSGCSGLKSSDKPSVSSTSQSSSVKIESSIESTDAITESSSSETENEAVLDVDWPNNGLGNALPKPTEGEVTTTYTDKAFKVNIKSLSEDAATKYIKRIAKRFSKDSQKVDNTYYYGYDKDGYRVECYYSDTKKELEIAEIVPIDSGDITWPTEGLSTLIPRPDSNKGYIDFDIETSFNAYVSGINKKMFKKYTKQLQKAGYDTVESNTSDLFMAKNKDGISVNVKYLGNNNIYLWISK